MPFLRLKRC